MAFFLLLFIGFGWWRSSGVGPQVQVPMFYDAHYLFPRPWTQEQSVPGVPEPAPLAFFGFNRISQSFVSGSDQLSMIEVWLAGGDNEQVNVSLVGEHGESISGEFMLTEGREGAYYHLAFEPIENARGKLFTLTLKAPKATIENPVVTHTVGGDRLGGAFTINEYNRPGNLSLQAFASGIPGMWWLDAVGEQILPTVFELRLQQYKSPIFKGLFFPVILLVTASLSILFLILARPQANNSTNQLSKATGWSIVLFLSLLLIWQLSTGRALAKPFVTKFSMNGKDSISKSPAPGSAPRLMNDFVTSLWTAERYPEERFISSSTVADFPAIHVPADSRLGYNIDVPPNARFRVGVTGTGQGDLQAVIRIGSDIIYEETVLPVLNPGPEDISWVDLDLYPWAGQPVVLILETEGETSSVDGWWVMPQIETDSDWLLVDPPTSEADFTAVNYQFGGVVELIGYRVTPTHFDDGVEVNVKLYWRPLQELGPYGKVFLHLEDEQGELVAQDDRQPVNNSYPIPLWQIGTIIIDEHVLFIPSDKVGSQVTLAVGIYDPDSLQRWPVVNEDGQTSVEGRAVLPGVIEVSP